MIISRRISPSCAKEYRPFGWTVYSWAKSSLSERKPLRLSACGNAQAGDEGPVGNHAGRYTLPKLYIVVVNEDVDVHDISEILVRRCVNTDPQRACPPKRKCGRRSTNCFRTDKTLLQPEMPIEADTCRTLITPKLQAAGWENDPHSIAEQRTFTDGRIIVRGNKAERRKGKRADYILRYTRDFPIAVVEAKPEDEPAAAGMQQSKDYAEILKLKFAYATNGQSIIEFDYLTGLEREITAFPTPSELWSRLRAHEKLSDDSAAQRLLTPANFTTGKDPRYYQQIAINSVLQSILQGKRRILLTMATGTGKTVVAFQICWKLWSSKWNSKGDPTRKPRILYLADRNFLVDDPKDKTFSAFGDARHKIEGGNVVHSRELYFATYQSIAKDERRPGLYKEFAPDFFDLIIVDECHGAAPKKIPIGARFSNTFSRPISWG